ncbi:enoyl-CoA hydratase-related protein [Pseudorhizobium flavum]|uniref:1,4-dihydroxy-2-naphthoyl-CoA synthase n=1 Tax=Pseudorhizobium flavum TaxID=1335061 RepID=A0A7W9Z0R2_9HYPH|nr:enoyl-CoA hydratase-related protein [Pseudorhizobium flavum]MBB6181928.1 2-ketocyclohexanecarboxyl-CoA hydrolase [Pseudorhizobium flavum]CAD6628776.1 2-ketocyclohexanecarboxyl-CoA hydrolase [Pseudorhizobium flavum]
MNRDYTDIIYTVEAGVANIAINRPDRLNAYREQTYDDVLDALLDAAWDKNVGVIVISGVGGKAFGVGGDSGVKKADRRGRGMLGVPIEEIHNAIRDAPKPVIAKVDGFAIGGGNVIATICDLTVASEHSQFGQVGPKVGSVDPGFGTAYLARIVGEKKAREMWYLCRRYSAEEAMRMGLVNAVVPADRLDAEVAEWCAMILERSPTALALAKRSFNADTDNIRGIAGMGMQTLMLYYQTDEAKEGGNAFREKRKPEFRSKAIF